MILKKNNNVVYIYSSIKIENEPKPNKRRKKKRETIIIIEHNISICNGLYVLYISIFFLYQQDYKLLLICLTYNIVYTNTSLIIRKNF